MAVSQNGWSANDASLTQTYTVGNGRQVRLRKGDAGFLLKTFADWFDAKIEDIDAGQLDDWGYAERPIRDAAELSNHASGTAIDLNALKHPLGARGTFPAAKADAIRQHLAIKFEGAIRWGGDYKNRADEMHFEINTNVAEVARIAAKIRRADAPEKPAAPRTPTIADIVVALQRLEANSKNNNAEERYSDAIEVLNNIAGSGRVRVPTSTAEIRVALRAKVESGRLSKDQYDRITSALPLLKGI